MLQRILTLLACAGALAVAAENKVMHCFTFTPVEKATDADWQAFFRATDALPSKVPGLTRVWYGKLRSPQRFLQFTAAETNKEAAKRLRSGEPRVTGEVRSVVRTWGTCMEFESEAALKSYDKHPAHEAWNEVYFKVREYGTTTFDILPVGTSRTGGQR